MAWCAAAAAASGGTLLLLLLLPGVALADLKRLPERATSRCRTSRGSAELGMDWDWERVGLPLLLLLLPPPWAWLLLVWLLKSGMDTKGTALLLLLLPEVGRGAPRLMEPV